MTAHDVARSAGLELRQKGSRWWACCPLHSEKTPSFCIFPDGRWKCFGCGRHGDAADLYTALYKVTLGEALRAVRDDAWQPRPRKPTGSDLRRKVEAWKTQHWHRACIILHGARFVIAHSVPDSGICWEAIRLMAEAQDDLNLLDAATPGQLVTMMNMEAQP